MHQNVIAGVGEDPDFVHLWVHAVFEGFSTNTFDSGLSYLQNDHGEVDPFYAYCAGETGEPPPIYGLYHTDQYMGTPYTVIVDREGTVLTQDFTSEYMAVELVTIIEEALGE